MPPSAELPPPPEHPELPPEVQIPGEEELAFRTEDGVLIEARGYFPATEERAIVLSVAKRLLERGQAKVGWLRLNFRGVGRSEGRHDGATREVLDVLAAFTE